MEYSLFNLLYLTCLEMDSCIQYCSKCSLEEYNAGLGDFIWNEGLEHCLCMV